MLIDEDTYSAASICAATIRDYGGTLMGCPSLGDDNFFYAIISNNFETPNYKISFELPLVGAMRDSALTKTKHKNLQPKILLHGENAIETAIDILQNGTMPQ